ncbi:cupin domain-containing protein [Actinomadura gamaensis]|uniref:Cupin domain-containing protein n=1 Tax=Actinomadura gamaensis TaxID=1763541 RepID=A0ABV9U7M5_9ACTN
MSLFVPDYPAPRYQRETGELSATFRRADSAPDFHAAPAGGEGTGTDYRYLATQQSTDGDYGLYRVDMGPEPGGPGMHFHKAMSESFFILSGEMRVHDGDKWITATSGDFLYVPPGGLHAFRNESGEPASMLMIFAPGAPRERYFEDISEIGDLTDAERAEWFVRHDSFFVN